MVATATIEPACRTGGLPRPLPMQPEEMDVLEPQEIISVSKWAGKFRRLSRKTTDIDGDWSHEYTPHLVEIMDSLSEPGIRQVTLVKCGQSAGTEAGLNFLGWAVEQSPAPMLLVMPREEDVNRRVATRIRPMFESTPTLLRHLYGDLSRLNIGKETELDNMILYLAWATSPAALSDNPICYVVLDEVGKFPPKSGREADPISLAKDRQRTFFSRAKLYVLSTPVVRGDLIDREYRRGDRREWWARCPHCGESHVLVWKNVQLDHSAEGHLLEEDAYLAGSAARYVCPACREPWTEQDRWAAVTAGCWLPDGCAMDASGRVVGRQEATTHRSYHVSALMLHPHFVSIDRLAAQWADAQLHAKAGDLGPLQDFVNSQLGEPWEEVLTRSDVDQIQTHIGDYPAGVVPEAAVLLTAGVDVQADHLWIAVLAWGYLSECWLVYDGRIETGDTREVANYGPLREALRMTWPRAEREGVSVPIRKACVDMAYRGDVVSDFCRQATEVDVSPIRGDQYVKSFYRTAKVAGGAMLRYDLNVNAYKDRLERLLSGQRAGPGYLHIHTEATTELLEHLTSEHRKPLRDRRGRSVGHEWAVRSPGLANHLWDCCVYATFAADLAGARMIRDPEAAVSKIVRRHAVMDRFRERRRP